MQKFLTSRLLHIIILLSMLCVLVFIRIGDPDWSKMLRYKAFDTYNHFHLRQPRNDVVIVDIDENSLHEDKQGQWPWPRHVVGKLVSNLNAMGAKSIVFDMVFSEPDRTSPEKMIGRLPQEYHSNLELLETINSLPDPDMVFANDIAAAGNVVTGFIWSNSDNASSEKPQQSRPILVSKTARSLVQTVPKIKNVVSSLPIFAKSAAGNGCFGVLPSVDGIIREVPLLFSKENSFYPSLAVEALRVGQNPKQSVKLRELKAEEKTVLSPDYELQIGKYSVPLDSSGMFYVQFSPPRPDIYISAHDVITGTVDPASIQGKIVLVGTSAEGLKDLRSTPLNLFVPGVELHLNVIEQILGQNFLQRPSLIEGAELWFIISIGLLVIGFSVFMNPFSLAAITLFIAAGVGYLSITGYVNYGLLLDPVFPSASIFVLSVVAALLSYLRTEMERRAVRQAFGLYISPTFMNELTKDPDKLRLGGEIRDISVMFTDIRNFTTISEKLLPSELIQLMNDFLTPMSDLVMSHRGTIDKYMGDAMMAFWNAPLDDPDHARNACIAALEMNKALVPINERLKQIAEEKGDTPILLKAGIGVNTGPGAVGNMGSKQRFAYSVLGDTVNLASRLEGQTKAYGVEFLIGENTWEHVSDFAGLELDLIKVKGKKKPVRIYTILDMPEAATSTAFKQWQNKHNEMLALYRTQQWEKAKLFIAELLNTQESAIIAGYYTMLEQRITELQKTPFSNEWNGVYEATSK